MKMIFFLFSAILFYVPASGQSNDALLAQLNAEIVQQPLYVKKKQQRIDSLTMLAHSSPPERRFSAYEAVYNEYRSFKYDSAFLYAIKLNQLARGVHSYHLINDSKIKVAFVLISSGLFNQALDTLQSIRSSTLSDSLRTKFCYLMARTYYDLADYSQDLFYGRHYGQKAEAFIDSAMGFMNPASHDYWLMRGLKFLHLRDMVEARNCYEKLISDKTLPASEYAVVASTLSFIYFYSNEKQKAKGMLIKAAISDVRSCTRETLATMKLAEMLYNEGDVDNAYLYVKSALQDAEFYGARQRKVQVAAIYPVIESKHFSIMESKRKQLVVYSLLITLVSLTVMGFSFVFYKQNKKLQKARRIITKANGSLTETNQQLQDANKIKEEYIWYYFSTTAEYISKLDSLKKTLELKLMTKKMEDLKFAVDNINIKRERDELYHNFDRVFLKLFPDFITVFNSLLRGEDRIILKEGQLLNTELRIFALIRMGIHDHERIAKILDYSVTTIYTYKTRVRNKSIYPGDEFDKRIMSIRAI